MFPHRKDLMDSSKIFLERNQMAILDSENFRRRSITINKIVLCNGVVVEDSEECLNYRIKLLLFLQNKKPL